MEKFHITIRQSGSSDASRRHETGETQFEGSWLLSISFSELTLQINNSKKLNKTGLAGTLVISVSCVGGKYVLIALERNIFLF